MGRFGEGLGVVPPRGCVVLLILETVEIYEDGREADTARRRTFKEMGMEQISTK
jgi:hypothetical protein